MPLVVPVRLSIGMGSSCGYSCRQIDFGFRILNRPKSILQRMYHLNSLMRHASFTDCVLAAQADPRISGRSLRTSASPRNP